MLHENLNPMLAKERRQDLLRDAEQYRLAQSSCRETNFKEPKPKGLLSVFRRWSTQVRWGRS